MGDRGVLVRAAAASKTVRTATSHPVTEVAVFYNGFTCQIGKLESKCDKAASFGRFPVSKVLALPLMGK